MKVKIKKTKYRSVTLRLDEKVMQRVDEVAKEHEISRQCVIEKILETAMNDKKFEIEVSKNDY
jgi:predicted transcriptional regulator